MMKENSLSYRSFKEELENWSEERVYHFELKNAKIPKYSLPKGYSFLVTEKNHFTRKERELYITLNSKNRLKILQSILHGGSFNIIFILHEIRPIASVVIIQDTEETGRLELAWTDPEYRRKGFYRLLHFRVLEECIKIGLEKISFCLSESWLLPFWLRILT